MEQPVSDPDPIEVVSSFAIDGKLLALEPHGSGHIHNTYLGRWQGPDGVSLYIHQQINSYVFPDVARLMENIERVIEHIGGVVEADSSLGYSAFELVPTRDHRSCFVDDAGQVWRTYSYVPNSEIHQVCPSEEYAEEAARIAGLFGSILSSLPPSEVHEVLPQFQDTSYRFSQLDEALSQAPTDRFHRAEELVQRLMEYRRYEGAITDKLDQGMLARSVAHFDLKLNNILFVRGTPKALAVTDLDTCMPGSVLFDFGDLARNICFDCAEDEQDLSKVQFHQGFYRALVKGFFTHGSSLCGPEELKMLPIAPVLLALNLSVRFLTDYLLGDKYFKVHQADHNLIRATTQATVAQELHDHMGWMEEIVGR